MARTASSASQTARPAARLTNPHLSVACGGSGNNGGSSKTKIPDQEPTSVVAHASSTRQVYGSTTSAMDQGYGTYFPMDQGMSASNQQLLAGTYYLPANAMPYAEQVPVMTEQQHPPEQSYSVTCAYGSTATVADQYCSSAAAAPAGAGEEPVQSTNEETLEWFRLHGNDLLADAAEPTTAEHSMLNTSTAEPHHDGLDEQEKLFWRSIWVDTDNIVF
ncbi:unnamed protein product [Urochloa humidicola]